MCKASSMNISPQPDKIDTNNNDSKYPLFTKLKLSIGKLRPWLIWVGCFLVSLTPLLAIHFFGNIVTIKQADGTDVNFDFSFWNKIDIFFVCVSMIASALFEKISNRNHKLKIISIVIIGSLILLMILSSILYASLYISISVFENELTSDMSKYGKVFLITTFILGSAVFCDYPKEN